MTIINRKTKETNIEVSLKPYSEGKSDISTGIGFFDHMLEAFAKHSLIDLNVKCKGDLHIDGHHSVEDIGIVIGQALKKSIFPISGIERFGEASVPLDEALCTSVIDLSNRPFLFFDIDLVGFVGEFDVELTEEFFRAVCINAGFCAHITCVRGSNKHHIIEAGFKSFAVALRRALNKNKNISTPSTKGIL